MRKPNLGGLESVSPDLIDRSRYHDHIDLINELFPLYRNFEQISPSQIPFLYGGKCINVNGESITPQVSLSSLGPGSDVWCFITRNPDTEITQPQSQSVSYNPGVPHPPKFKSIITTTDKAREVEGIIVYAFRVLTIFEDGTFQQFAYGLVDISGIPEIYDGPVAPFHVTVIGYRDDKISETQCFVYIPTDKPCIIYNGKPCPFADTRIENNFYKVELDEKGTASVFAYVERHDSIFGATYSAHVTQTEPQVGDKDGKVVAVIPIADIGHEGNTLPGPKDVPEDESSDDSSEEITPRFAVEEVSEKSSLSLPRDGSVRYRTLLRPFCVTAFDKPENHDYAMRTMMYLPESSILVNSKPLRIAFPEEKVGDLLPLEVGTYWCVIAGQEEPTKEGEVFFKPDGTFDDDTSPDFTAEIIKSEERPRKKNSVIEFKIAEVFSETFGEGAFQEYTYGEVTISHTESGVHHIVPFQIFIVTLTDANFNQQRNFFCYTPVGRTLLYNGHPLSIDGAEGDWTRLPVDGRSLEVPTMVWCYMKKPGDEGDDNENYDIIEGDEPSGKALLTTDKKKIFNGGLKFFFPVACIDSMVEDRDLGDESRAVLVGVQASKITGDLPGAAKDTAAMESALSGYLTSMIVLNDEAATGETVRNAMKWAVSSNEGAAVLYFSAHGNYIDGHNYVCLYDERLTDDEVWGILKTARCPVWLIFDTCHSGTMYGPPDAESEATHWGSYMRDMARRDGVSINMLCWSAASDNTVAWGNVEDGGAFTNTILRHIKKGRPYHEIWHLVAIDPKLNGEPYKQSPVASEIGSFWGSRKFFLERN